MVKHIISIAAAGAVLTTGAMAFDTNTNGEIRSFPSNTISSIDSGAAAADEVLKHQGTQGDALIYPLFMNDGNYSSEIVVRNTSNNAVVAKAVLYSGDDSQELLDFNIYLSGKDVCRFTINNNTIYSEDESLRIDGIKPSDVNNAAGTTDYSNIKFASASAPFRFNFQDSTVNLEKYKNGYIIIYGMVELDPMASETVEVPSPSYLETENIAFHNKHDSLYAAYAKILDDKRAGWRDITNIAVLKESVFISSVKQSPNQELANDVVWKNEANNGTLSTTIHSVKDDTLSGEIRLVNTDAKTDVILPATALQNFTPKDDSGMLWAEREYASISDRCLDKAIYSKTCIENDAETFNVATANYTYSNKSNNGLTDNRVYVTQPYKRILVQRAYDNNSGYGYTGASTTVNTLRTGANVGFVSSASVYDENEQFSVKVTAIGNTGLNLSGTANQEQPDPDKFTSEVEMMDSSAFEQSDVAKANFANKDGFAEFNVGVPSIITQMVATKSGDACVTNWVYSNTKKN